MDIFRWRLYGIRKDAGDQVLLGPSEGDDEDATLYRLELDGRLTEVANPYNIGIVVGERIYWTNDIWTKCETDRMELGDRVFVLDGGAISDGFVYTRSNLSPVTYDVIVFGKTTDERFVIKDVSQEVLRRLNVGILDKLELIMDGLHYFVDIGLDIAAVIIFVQKGQWKYLALTCVGMGFSGMAQTLLSISLALESGQDLTCIRVVQFFPSSFFGFSFFQQFRETWRRGYRTQAFNVFKMMEAVTEGAVSLLVQLYALLYEDEYSLQQSLIISISILSSAYGYADVFGVQYAELADGRDFKNPEDRRTFLKGFPIEVILVKVTRFFEVLTRGSVAIFFCYAFRPYGFVLFILHEVSTLTFAYMVTGRHDLGNALANAATPGFWLTITEPFLAPKTYGDGKNKAFLLFALQAKILGGVAMMGSISLLRKNTLEMLCEGHRLHIAILGSIGSLLIWIGLLAVIVYTITESPRLNYQAIKIEDTEMGHPRSTFSGEDQSVVQCC